MMLFLVGRREEGINIVLYFYEMNRDHAITGCGYLWGNGVFSPEPLVTGLSICDQFLDKCIVAHIDVKTIMVYY